jgi:hypothetical protein
MLEKVTPALKYTVYSSRAMVTPDFGKQWKQR